MRETRIAIRYAKALFDLALERNTLEQIKTDMELVVSVFKQNRNLRIILQSPIINEKKKVAITKAIFENKLREISLHFLIIIIRKRREANILAIAEQFIILYKDYKKITTTFLQTVVKIDDNIKKKVVELMKHQTEGEIELIEEIKKELIGGFVLSFKDKQYDASILRQIENLKKEFDINLYIKGL